MSTLIETYLKDLAFTDDFIKTPKGDIETIEGIANVRQALFARLITSKGTIIHRPDFGVGIKDYQNSISSLSRQQELAQRIGEQFSLDPRVSEVVSVSINYSDSTPEKVEILVKIKLIGYGAIVTGKQIGRAHV